MAVKITSDEWLAELARLSSRNDEGLTAQEWADALGLSIKLMRAKIGAAKKLGWVKVGAKTAYRMDEQPYTAPVYHVVKPKK